MTQEEIMEQVKNNTILDNDNLEVLSNDHIFETEEIIPLKDNDGGSTLEYVTYKHGDYEPICDNEPSESQKKQRMIEIGNRIANLLNLEKNKNGFYETNSGNKNEEGLAATIMELIKEVDY